MTKPNDPGAQEVHEFDEQKFNEVLQSLSAATTVSTAEITTLEEMTQSGGELSAQAECIGVVAQNGRVCLKIPIVGTVCIPVNFGLPNGTAAEACVSVKTKWGFPVGVCVEVRAAGITIVKQCWGL
jgi:tetrahydromethanopterin S-methyltransferase subunit H